MNYKLFLYGLYIKHRKTFVLLGFEVETFWLEFSLTKHIKRYSIKLKFARL